MSFQQAGMPVKFGPLPILNKEMRWKTVFRSGLRFLKSIPERNPQLLHGVCYTSTEKSTSSSTGSEPVRVSTILLSIATPSSTQFFHSRIPPVPGTPLAGVHTYYSPKMASIMFMASNRKYTKLQDERRVIFKCIHLQVCSLWFKYASMFSGPLLPLSHPSPRMAPYLPVIHHDGSLPLSEGTCVSSYGCDVEEIQISYSNCLMLFVDGHAVAWQNLESAGVASELLFEDMETLVFVGIT
eukprot:1156717-Pelagomonas_calceolata.AAC.4